MNFWNYILDVKEQRPTKLPCWQIIRSHILLQVVYLIFLTIAPKSWYSGSEPFCFISFSCIIQALSKIPSTTLKGWSQSQHLIRQLWNSVYRPYLLVGGGGGIKVSFAAMILYDYSGIPNDLNLKNESCSHGKWKLISWKLISLELILWELISWEDIKFSMMLHISSSIVSAIARESLKYHIHTYSH